jgi:hypothetical protein
VQGKWLLREEKRRRVQVLELKNINEGNEGAEGSRRLNVAGTMRKERVTAVAQRKCVTEPMIK